MEIFWGGLLRSLRRSHHLTQDEVASILRVTRQTVSNIETGRCKPSPETLAVLSFIFDLDLIEYASSCMPLEYVQEQKEFKYNIPAARIPKKRRRGPNKKQKKKPQTVETTDPEPAHITP